MNDQSARAAWDDARSASPGLDVPFEAFAARLESALGSADAAELSRLNLRDLYLCAGCLLGLPAALVQLERQHLARLPQRLARFAAQGVAVDEVLQALRVKLLGAAGEAPRLLQYAGRGALDRWLEAAALRAAIDARRAQPALQPLSDGASGQLLASARMELSCVRAELVEPFRKAVKAALRNLPPRARRVLALHYLHGLTTERIGALYGTHRVTVTRWLVAARQQILEEVQAALGAELGSPSHSGVGSVWRLLRSEVTVSLPRLLGEEEGPPGDRGSPAGR
jgi:RNA polymerase sigma-70 factor (ECF subfamily)